MEHNIRHFEHLLVATVFHAITINGGTKKLSKTWRELLIGGEIFAILKKKKIVFDLTQIIIFLNFVVFSQMSSQKNKYI